MVPSSSLFLQLARRSITRNHGGINSFHRSLLVGCRSIVAAQQQARTRKRPRIQQARCASTEPSSSSIDGDTTATTNIPNPNCSFRDLPNLRSDLKDVVVDTMGLQDNNMTDIQTQAWQPTLEGKDLVGRSETGSGKTLAYLLPALQRILDTPPPPKGSTGGVRLLILAPTRELVQQIHSTVATLLQHQNHHVTCQPLSGGVPRRRDVQVWNEHRCLPTILTATPGRLEHHVRVTSVGTKRLRDILAESVEIVVLDEMDRLLDMGFRHAIRSILAAVPKRNRQTLLFSATAPASVQHMIQWATKNDPVLIDCRREQQAVVVPTVEQSYAVLPIDTFVAGIVRTILHLMKAPHHKVIVFFPTTSQVAYFTDVFQTGLGRKVFELRSPLHPTVRQTQADAFRYATTGATLLATDVCARGMDFPGVTTVVQVGAPSHRDTYIHRLGRTARAGTTGNGILLLLEGERVLETDLADMDITVHRPLQKLIDTEVGNALIDEDLLSLQQAMLRGTSSPRLARHAAAAYVGLFAFYTQHFHVLGMESSAVVRLVNAFAEQVGLATLPAVPRRLAQQYRLDGHPRLNIQRGLWKDRTFDVTGGRHHHYDQQQDPSRRERRRR